MSLRSRILAAVRAATSDAPATPAPRTPRADGWESTITGLGTARDKRSGTRIKVAPSQGSRDQYDAYYHGDDTAATIADLPAKEMTRAWITLQVDDSTGEQQRTEADTADKMLVSKQIMQALDDVGAKGVIAEALTWSRVHGGALIFLGVDDGAEDLSEPLDLDRVRRLEFLTVFDRWDAQIQTTNTDIRSSDFGMPETYLLQPQSNAGIAGVVSEIVHASRFIRFDGTLTSRQRQAYNSGWADSIYTRMEETLQDYGISWHAIAHLLQDFSQAVFSMHGLADALAEDESGLIINRLTAMDLCRSVARAVPIDAESESFQRVATPMSGLPDTIDRLMLRVSSAARIPATLLFGQSPSGLNATGESDIRLFYDHISAEQESVVRPRLDRLLDVLLRSAEGPTRGREPENWSYTFNPLWQATAKEQAETRKAVAETDAIYLDRGVVDPDEISQSRFGGDTYSPETVLDTEKREPMALPEVDSAAMGGDDVERLVRNLPAPDPEEASAQPQQTLNGAQIASLVDTVRAVIAGEIPRDTGMQIILAGFPFDLERIERLFAEVERGAGVVPADGAL